MTSVREAASRTSAQKRAVVILSEWRIVYQDSHVYRSPEQRRIALIGRVEGHESHADGTRVTTSPIDLARVNAKKREVTTASGRVYRLAGPPDPEYLELVEERAHLAGTGQLAKIVENAKRTAQRKRRAG